MEGVYFTDYRQTQKPKQSTCGPKDGLPEFVSLERVEAITSEDELRYVWSEVLKRWTWLQESTVQLFEFPDEWDFIKENVAVVKKYKQMIEVMEGKRKDFGMEILNEKELKEQNQTYEQLIHQYQQMEKLFKGGAELSNPNQDEGLYV